MSKSILIRSLFCLSFVLLFACEPQGGKDDNSNNMEMVQDGSCDSCDSCGCDSCGCDSCDSCGCDEPEPEPCNDCGGCGCGPCCQNEQQANDAQVASLEEAATQE